MRAQFSLRTLLVFVTVVAVLCGLVIALFRSLTTITKLDLGNGRTAVIGTGGLVDVLIRVKCKVVDGNGRTLFPWKAIGDAGMTSDDRTGLLEFSVVSADDGEVVGIVEEHNPNVIAALYDFRTGESWHDVRADVPPEAAAYAERWKEARLQRLEKVYPGRHFDLDPWSELGVPR